MPSKPSSSPVRKLLTRLLPKLLPVVALALSSAAAGCVLYGEPDRSCADVVCGNNASCGGDAECFCDAGHEGNPYEGCVSTHPAVDPDCKLDCGANAYCAKDTCFCDVDHVAVCGVNAGCMAESQLCDGTADCPDEADENVAVCQPPVFQDWIITDACDDGVDVTWRIFSLDRDWAWPGVDTTFRTSGLLVDTYATIQCFEGETICAAAVAGDRSWGLALDGTGTCEACCFTCGDMDLADAGYLECS